MRGIIRLGRWLPFRAQQVLNPHVGFIWAARAGGVINGSDRYLEGIGGMNWKLGGLLTVAHAEGIDVSRSAAGRGGTGRSPEGEFFRYQILDLHQCRPSATKPRSLTGFAETTS